MTTTILIAVAVAVAAWCIVAGLTLVILYAVCCIGSHRHDPVGYTLWLYGQELLLAPHEDHPCTRCGDPTGWTWFGRPVCPTCRKREIEEL